MSDSVKKYYELVEEGAIDPNKKITKPPYIYESPDGGKTVYRRQFNKYGVKELVKETRENTYTELELAEAILRASKNYENAAPGLILKIAKDELSVKKVCN